jgi:S-formylglutathione hydrolase FrmB
MSLDRIILGLSFSLIITCPALKSETKILDLRHDSHVFGEERNYRIFLPPSYDAKPEKRYPVVYFFHGWGERYNQPTREGAGGYDSANDYQGDNIASFVEQNDVIVVKWDGYNPRTPEEKYPRPYNIGPVETYRQFPFYFPELVQFIDTHYRTIADRDHRGVSGLSMGGFMSFWIGGKYPHLLGSVSNFMGSAEFAVGPKAFPSEYLHSEMYCNYEGIRTRLVLGTRDFIRWYHWQMNKIWDYTRPHYEHETFDWDHGTPGMAKQLRFHMNAFAHPLPRPATWHHIDVYPTFEVWGYSVTSNRHRPGFTVLKNVTPAGFRSSVQEWMPDGQRMPSVRLNIVTDALYSKNALHQIVDVNLRTRENLIHRVNSDGEGRLHIDLDGDLHEVGISRSDPLPILSLAGFSLQNGQWAIAGKEVSLKVDLLNKGTATARNLVATLSSPNSSVAIVKGQTRLAQLAPGRVSTPGTPLAFQVSDPAREIVQLELNLQCDGTVAQNIPFEIRLFPDVASLESPQIADGRGFRVQVGGNQTEERRLGIGNGDGIVNPGESFLAIVKDQGEFRWTSLYTTDSYVNPAGLNLRYSDDWGNYDHVGGSAKYSMPTVSAHCPPGHEIVFFAEYWLPNAPEHVIKRGVIKVRVQGEDRTGPEARWAEISAGNLLEAQMIEGGAIKTVKARLAQTDNPAFPIEMLLNDRGMDGDKSAGDRIFSGSIPGSLEGAVPVVVDAIDEFGNQGSSAFDLKPR